MWTLATVINTISASSTHYDLEETLFVPIGSCHKGGLWLDILHSCSAQQVLPPLPWNRPQPL